MMDVINWDYPAIARSVLIKSEDDGRTFRTVWEGREDNKFVNIAPVISSHPTTQGKDALYLVGSGKYRESPIYLAVTEIDAIENRAGYLYFAGLENGSPVWKTSESDALPIVDGVKVGEFSVRWNGYLGKWLLSYFDYSTSNPGNMYIRTASNLWGPWSNPVFVFSGARHYDWYEEVMTRKGPQSWGVPYGSYLLPENKTAQVVQKIYFYPVSLGALFDISDGSGFECSCYGGDTEINFVPACHRRGQQQQITAHYCFGSRLEVS